MLKKPCLLFKIPKICNIYFWIENDPSPPLWHFSKNSLDLVAGSFPEELTMDRVAFTRFLTRFWTFIQGFKEGCSPSDFLKMRRGGSKAVWNCRLNPHFEPLCGRSSPRMSISNQSIRGRRNDIFEWDQVLQVLSQGHQGSLALSYGATKYPM